MRAFSARNLHAAWLALLGATLASYWSGGHASASFAMLAVMIFAGGKVGIILSRFMEVGRAPALVKFFFAAWVALCVAVIAGLHVLAESRQILH